MPFVATGVGALIVGALAGGGVAGTAFLATWVGAAAATAINYGLAIGISALSSQLFAASASDSNGSVSRSSQLNLQVGSSIPRQLALGVCATAGSLVYWQLSGSDNQVLDLVYSLADWPCTELLNVMVDGVRRGLLIQNDGSYLLDSKNTTPQIKTRPNGEQYYTFDSLTSNDDSKVDYEDKVKITFHNGSFTQSADSGLISRSGGTLDINFKGKGCCYVVVTLLNDTFNATTQDQVDNSAFPNGLPKFMFELKGCKFYDYRKDSTVLGGNGLHRWDDVSTWEFTNNPAIIYYNWRRGLWYNSKKLYGLTNSFSSIDLLTYINAANVCDELITSIDYLQGNSGTNITVKRYTANGVVTLNTAKSALLKDLSMCMGSDEVEVGGMFKLYAGSTRSISAVLNRTDTIIDTSYTYISKKPSNELVNSVFGEFHSNIENYQVISLPNRANPFDIEADGMQHEVKYRFGLVTNPEQAQRLMEIIRRKERYQATVTCMFTSDAAMLEPGDWIMYSDVSKGWLNKIFMITSMPENSLTEVAVNMREINPDVFTWSDASYINISEIGKVVYTKPPLNQVLGLHVDAIVITNSGSSNQRPALRVTWTPITDLSVTKIIFEYRIKGTTDKVLNVETSLPSSGAYSIINGIISSEFYEVRALIQTSPVRAVQWTGWIESITVSGIVIVPVGTHVAVIPDNSISEIKLTEQERYLLHLSTQVSEGLGSGFDFDTELPIYALIDDYNGWVEHKTEVELNVLETNTAKALIKVETDLRVSENAAFAQQLTTVEGTVNNANTVITQEITARTLADTQLGTLISTVETQTDDLSSAVSVAQTSINGIESKYTVTVSNQGVINGTIQLDNTNQSSAFRVAVDSFIISTPTGSNSQSIFRLDTSTNPARIVFNGDFFTTGQISADKINANELSSITADLGTITAGMLRSANGKSYFDLDNNILVLGTT